MQINMTELLIGQHCSLQNCNILDFLPITCQYCKNIFCKEHFLPEKHFCVEVQKCEIELPKINSVQRYECSVEGCAKAELAPVLCPMCQVMVCLGHRFQSDHGCIELKAPTRAMAETKAMVDQILNTQNSLQVKKKPLRSVKAQKTAAKVQLMKLKMKSVGDKGLPQQERVYFLVTPPKLYNKQSSGVWISEKWVIGRVIDFIADTLGVKNENNVSGKKKLKIFRSSDGKSVCEDMSVQLSKLLSDEEIFNGDSVIFEYAENDVDFYELER